VPSRPVSFPVSFIYYSLESGLESGPHLDRFLSCPILCYMLSHAKMPPGNSLWEWLIPGNPRTAIPGGWCGIDDKNIVSNQHLCSTEKRPLCCIRTFTYV